MLESSDRIRQSTSRLLLIAPFFFWGTAMVAMKEVLPQTNPLFVATVRLGPAGLLVLLAAVLLGRPQPQGWRAWGWIVGFALIDGTLFQGFLAEGLMRTSAGLGSVMIDSQPLAVALLARWLFGECIGGWGWWGLGLGILGISLIGLPEIWTLKTLTSWIQTMEMGSGFDLGSGLTSLFQNGYWWMLLAALSMAVGTVMVRVLSRYVDPVVATGWHMVLGSLPLAMLSLRWEGNSWMQLDSGHWLALGYTTVFGSALAYSLFFYLAAQGNLTSLSALTFLTPIFALLFGHFLLGETLNISQAMGVGLTLVSIYLVNQREELRYRWQSIQALLFGKSLLSEGSSSTSGRR